MYVCMYVCIYVYMYVCMYVCMYMGGRAGIKHKYTQETNEEAQKKMNRKDNRGFFRGIKVNIRALIYVQQFLLTAKTHSYRQGVGRGKGEVIGVVYIKLSKALNLQHVYIYQIICLPLPLITPRDSGPENNQQAQSQIKSLGRRSRAESPN